MKLSILCLLLATCIVPISPNLQADDWPHWLGPERDGIWRETGIVETFPEGGPKVLWRAPIAHGYSSPAVADGLVFVTDYEVTSGEIVNNPGARIPLQGRERVHALDLATGAVVWTHARERNYDLSYPGGPRAMPAVSEGKVFVIGAEGDLLCLDAKSGALLWTRELQKDYKTGSPFWGFSAHPLVIGDTLYAVVGGEGSVAVAFDKRTGAEKWRALSAAEPGYCPPTMIRHGGVDQLLIWHPESLNALNPLDGSVYWSLPLQPQYGMSIMAPRKEGKFLFASGIGRVGAAIELDDVAPAAKFHWKAKPKQAVFCANSSPIIVDGVIYGCDIDSSSLMAARLADGERLWQTTEPVFGQGATLDGARHGTVFLTKHEESGKFFLFSETGDLIFADLSPEGYREIARVAHVIEPTNEAFGRPVVWSAPAFAGQSVLLRNDKEIVRVNLAK
jgi:outer membrane protein assembly factor BamB